MARTYDVIDVRMARFITAAPVFFVGTAPLGPEGHVNVSPKGNLESLVVLGEHRVAYQDLTGSGAESLAHLRENGRIVIMVCAFTGPPRIVRLHGRGEAVTPGHPGWEELDGLFPARLGKRAVIDVTVDRISDSCGYGVPVMTFQHHRENLEHWAETKGPDGLAAYWAERNRVSLDGLPALP